MRTSRRYIMSRVQGMTGPVVIDYKGDRIMDYLVWYLASDSDKFNGYMKIPLTKAGRNTTACVEWLVRQYGHTCGCVIVLVHVCLCNSGTVRYHIYIHCVPKVPSNLNRFSKFFNWTDSAVNLQ